MGIAILDPLGEFGGWIRSLGGRVLAMGAEGSARLNPLDPATTGGDRAEKAGRVGALVRSLFPTLRDEESAVLDRSLRGLFDDGPAVPTFSDLIDRVERHRSDAGRLPTLLEVFRSCSLRHLDGPTSVSLSGSPLGFDFRGVPAEQMPFHLGYVLDAVYGTIRTNGGPRLAIVDEAHFLMRHPGTAEFLDRMVRHVRHFRSGLMVLSQNPEDFLRDETGASLLRNLRATLLLRLRSVSPLARTFFDLTRGEADWLTRARLPLEAGYSEGLLRFGPAHVPLAIVASSPELEFLNDTLAARDDPTVPSAVEPASDRTER
jgi:type IV secretory pathway VirB4 component